jgi:hypothetical protein
MPAPPPSTSTAAATSSIHSRPEPELGWSTLIGDGTADAVPAAGAPPIEGTPGVVEIQSWNLDRALV